MVDFAGGIVIHTSVGMGALAAAIVLGRRRFFGPAIEIPHSIPLAVVGSSLLWLGWFGFNGGSVLATATVESANAVAVVFMNTNAAASGGLIAALLVAKLMFGKADLT